MSKYPGEDLVITTYADIFYPSGDPIRFELSCYFYLYRHQSTARGRVEIANAPGQPSQDSFFGFLDDLTLFQYSYDQPSRVLFDIKSPQSQTREWMLSFKASGWTRLRRMIVYFWKSEDAMKVVDLVKTCVPAHLIRITGNPPNPVSSHSATNSLHGQTHPVVQRLERVALTDQAYPVRSSSTNSASTGMSFGPPPVQRDDDDDDDKDNEVPPTPSAYNPAAPAKPEKRVHRQKTPPPPEDEQSHPSGFPQAAPVAMPFGAGAVQPQRYGGPGMSAAHQPPLSPIGMGPGISPFAPKTPLSPIQTSFSGAPPRTGGAPLSPMITSIPTSIQGPASPIQASATPLAAPMGGYSGFQYTGNTGSQSGYNPSSQGPQAHQVHNQVYRPTEDEFSHQKGHVPQAAPSSKTGAPLRLEERARQIDKGVGKFGKWLEKKVG